MISSKVTGDLEDQQSYANATNEFDKLMLDKFVALDEEKCQFSY